VNQESPSFRTGKKSTQRKQDHAKSTALGQPYLLKKKAVWVTALSFLLLMVLTFDSLRQTLPGGTGVPAYTVIKQSIDYRLDTARNRYQPIIGGKELLFGQEYDAKATEALVALGKKTTQKKNCMNCHTFLGNGAYYAADLTKAWLDPG
jgi:nitric oxide reductase subunit C